MIHHLSLPADKPKHVASVLAEIMDGVVTEFIPGTDTYAAWTHDDHGTSIEIYPRDMTMQPGQGDDAVGFIRDSASGPFTGTHAAISVDRDVQALLSIADREGWRAMELNRGPFRVVEFWLENRVLIEFFTPDMANEYTGAIKGFLSSQASK